MQKNAKIVQQLDARYLFLLFFSGVLLDAFGLGVNLRTLLQFVFSLLSCLGLDILFNYFRHRKWIFPLSGLVSSMGTFALMASPFAWPYFISGSLAIYSKHFLRFRGRHIFNPANFGSLLILFFFNEYVQSGAGVWSGEPLLVTYFCLVGTILAAKVKRLVLCASYIGSYVLIHYLFLQYYLPVNIAALAAPPFMLFIFFMITDPATSPTNRWAQVGFAVAIALVEATFKYNRILHGGLWALFLICIVYNFLIPAVFLLRPKHKTQSLAY